MEPPLISTANPHLYHRQRQEKNDICHLEFHFIISLSPGGCAPTVSICIGIFPAHLRHTRWRYQYYIHLSTDFSTFGKLYYGIFGYVYSYHKFFPQVPITISFTHSDRAFVQSLRGMKERPRAKHLSFFWELNRSVSIRSSEAHALLHQRRDPRRSPPEWASEIRQQPLTLDLDSNASLDDLSI